MQDLKLTYGALQQLLRLHGFRVKRLNTRYGFYTYADKALTNESPLKENTEVWADPDKLVYLIFLRNCCMQLGSFAGFFGIELAHAQAFTNTLRKLDLTPVKGPINDLPVFYLAEVVKAIEMAPELLQKQSSDATLSKTELKARYKNCASNAKELKATLLALPIFSEQIAVCARAMDKLVEIVEKLDMTPVKKVTVPVKHDVEVMLPAPMQPQVTGKPLGSNEKFAEENLYSLGATATKLGITTMRVRDAIATGLLQTADSGKVNLPECLLIRLAREAYLSVSYNTCRDVLRLSDKEGKLRFDSLIKEAKAQITPTLWGAGKRVMLLPLALYIAEAINRDVNSYAIYWPDFQQDKMESILNDLYALIEQRSTKFFIDEETSESVRGVLYLLDDAADKMHTAFIEGAPEEQPTLPGLETEDEDQYDPLPVFPEKGCTETGTCDESCCAASDDDDAEYTEDEKLPSVFSAEAEAALNTVTIVLNDIGFGTLSEVYEDMLLNCWLSKDKIQEVVAMVTEVLESRELYGLANYVSSCFAGVIKSAPTDKELHDVE